MKPAHIVVEWADACQFSKVWDQDKCDKELYVAPVITTGYLVGEYDDFIAVANSYETDGQFWDIMCIPWEMVLEWGDA
jgi:hypothetical protein